MFRLWAKLFKDNRMIADTTICNNKTDSRTHKIFESLDAVCYEFDLERPIWLESTISDFQMHSKTRFTNDNFVEDIPFDYLEFHIIEED